MTISITSPVTGAAITGLTSPTFTLVTDTAPDINGRQQAVTALGGTQTGVVVHSAANPFTVTVMRPKVVKMLPPVNPNTGALPQVPNNEYKIKIRKGVIPLAGQAARVCQIDIVCSIPAGSETADANSIRAAVACAIGALTQQQNGLVDTLLTSIL